MIKRIQFASDRRQLGAASAMPLRAAICYVVHSAHGANDAHGPTAPHDAIVIAWFEDLAALHRYEAQTPSAPGSVIVAEEHILRGADWLERRWLDRTPKYKHMALARRAAGLSAAQFSERWRNRPGRVGGGAEAPTLEIPAAARGLAYVQNHPIHEALYDAINEVYFDDIASMGDRIAFFAGHNAAQADADLVSEAHFLIVEEQLIV